MCVCVCVCACVRERERERERERARARARERERFLGAACLQVPCGRGVVTDFNPTPQARNRVRGTGSRRRAERGPERGVTKRRGVAGGREEGMEDAGKRRPVRKQSRSFSVK